MHPRIWNLGKDRQPKIDAVINRQIVNAEKSERLAAAYLLSSGSPISHSDNNFFVRLLQSATSTGSPRRSDAIANQRIPELVSECVSSVVSQLPIDICLAVDGYSTVNHKMEIVGILAVGLTPEGDYWSSPLDLADLTGQAHTGETIVAAVGSCTSDS